MRELHYLLLDVFTRTPLAGNPLAVFFDAEGVEDSTLKAITRELGHSESTFVLPARRPQAAFRLRFFTPSGAEVYGAGHNALGAWWALAAAGRLPLAAPQNTFGQEIGDRVLAVEVAAEAGRPTRVSMTQSPPLFGARLEDRRALAAALGLPLEALDFSRLEAQAVSTGAWHLLVPARSRSALGEVRVDPERLVRVAGSVSCPGCYLFCLDPIEAGSLAHARAFNPGIGIAEDPATGSAAGPLVAYLVRRGLLTEGTTAVIEQGDSMGRPSRIEVRVDGERVEVGGECALVGEGILRV